MTVLRWRNAEEPAKILCQMCLIEISEFSGQRSDLQTRICSEENSRVLEAIPLDDPLWGGPDIFAEQPLQRAQAHPELPRQRLGPPCATFATNCRDDRANEIHYVVWFGELRFKQSLGCADHAPVGAMRQKTGFDSRRTPAGQFIDGNPPSRERSHRMIQERSKTAHAEPHSIGSALPLQRSLFQAAHHSEQRGFSRGDDQMRVWRWNDALRLARYVEQIPFDDPMVVNEGLKPGRWRISPDADTLC